MRWLPFIVLPSNSGLRQPKLPTIGECFFNLIINEKYFYNLKSSSLIVGGDRIFRLQ